MSYFHGTNPLLDSLLSKEEPETVRMRRYLHEHPEISGQEKETSAYVKAEAEKLNLPVETVGDYGLIVRIDGAAPGRFMMLRADMDALPIEEDPCNLKGPRCCISKNHGAMHACGHDGHTSMLISAMKVLAAYRDHFNGTVLCCFEQAEETMGGISAMLDALSKYPVTTAFGMHVYYAMESGKIDVSAGPRLAGYAPFELRIHGKGGHASRPDLCHSPITCGAQIISAWENAWTTVKHPADAVTLGIGQFSAGTAGNVIPDDAVIKGSLRFFDREAGAAMCEVRDHIAESIAALNGCTAEIIKPAENTNPLINDKGYSELAKKAVADAVGEEHVGVCDPWYVSETMTYYLERYPGVFGLLGIKNPDLGSGANHHTAQFDLDEDVLKIGVASAVSYALAALA